MECPASDYVSLMSRAVTQANRFLVAQMRQRGIAGIAPSHGDILVHLFRNDRMSMQELANAIGKDSSTVTALVKRLVAEGYAQTSKHPHDRRITLVELTEKGRGLRPEFLAISNALVETQMQGIDPADARMAYGIIDAIRNNFTQASNATSDKAD